MVSWFVWTAVGAIFIGVIESVHKVTIKAIGFPGRYIQGPGAIREVGAILNEFGCKCAVVVADDIVRQAAGDELDRKSVV